MFCVIIVTSFAGPLKIEILNHNEESLARMPSVTQGPGKKMVVELRIIYHSKKRETHSSKPPTSLIRSFDF